MDVVTFGKGFFDRKKDKELRENEEKYLVK